MAVARVASLALLLTSFAAAEDVAVLASRLATDGAREAADRLAELGPAARDAVPQLIAVLDSEDFELRWRAAWALSRMGAAAGPAAPALVLAALKGDGLPAAAAYIALKRVGRAGTDAVLASLQQAPDEERGRYLDLLRTVEPDPERVVPVLVDLLKDPADPSGWRACFLLMEMGPKAAAAVPALVARLRAVRREGYQASMVLLAIGEPAVGALRELALDPVADEMARGNAVGLLARIPGAGVAAAGTCLREIIHSEVWYWATMELGEGGPGAADLVPLLEQRVTRSGDAHYGTARALAAMGPKGEAALERLLFTGPAECRASLAGQLGDVDCAKTVPWLLRLASGSEPARVRSAAIESLTEALVQGEDARQAAAIAERDLETDALAACELARSLGPSAAHLAGKIRPLLADRDPRLRASAASALCRIGKATDADAALIADVLRNAAKNPTSRTYRHALECLAEAGPAAAAHWELLLEALSSEDVMTRCIAADGIERMLPGLGEDKWRALRAMETLRRPLDFSSVDDPATLVELLSREDPLNNASQRLVALGPRASEALLDALDGNDPNQRGRAAQTLLLIDARTAGEAAWRAALATPDAAFRLDDVCRAGPQDAIPHLMNALSSNDATARRTSAFLLKEVAHRDAAPAIRNLVLHDPDPDVRVTAIWALDALLPAP